jgi:cysteine desulfurase/selenocysteine lyase
MTVLSPKVTAPGPFSAEELTRIRADFPLLATRVRDGQELVYLDSAATAQRPRQVMAAMDQFSTNFNAAVHRGAHALAEEATERYEQARARISAFVGVKAHELIFTSGTTGAINLLALALGNATLGRGGAAARRFALRPGDKIVVTQAEHHSNLVPWQELAARTGAQLEWIGVDAHGRLLVEQSAKIIDQRTQVVAFTHASNVTGAITDVATLVAQAHDVGALTVLDAAQTAPHLPVDFAALGVDFAAMSAHKMLGPNAVGALYGREELLEALPPAWMGGSMVEIVTMAEATYALPPTRFEAGTGPVTPAIGWAAAVDYLSALGMDRVHAHEQALTGQLLDGLADLPGVRVLGPTDTYDRLGAVAVDVAGVHPHDAGQFLDAQGIAVRVGHHCAQPVHRALGTHSSVRASLALYNTAQEVDRFLEALGQVRAYFGAAGASGQGGN